MDRVPTVRTSPTPNSGMGAAPFCSPLSPRWRRAMAGAALMAGAAGLPPGLAAPPVTPAPAADLVAAHRWLERLASATRLEQPLTLVVRTAAAPSCPSASLACLRMSSLPSPLGGGYFVPFLMALVQQTDALGADPPAALAVANRTVVLHLPPTVMRSFRSAPADGATPDLTACLLARELTALQLGQPEKRAEAFANIHTTLAAEIAEAAKGGQRAQANRELGLFLFSPLLMTLSKATSPNEANPLSRDLLSSPHWLVLSGQAAPIAEALDGFSKLPEEALKKAWPELDGAFAMAAQDRLELVETQRRAAQEGALGLLAEAGLDPRPCAEVYQPAVTGDRLNSAVAVWERTRAHPAVAKRTLPRSFQPDGSSVVIFPPGAGAGPRPGAGAGGESGESQR
jgi:hypothetical protein